MQQINLLAIDRHGYVNVLTDDRRPLMSRLKNALAEAVGL
jgi:hypothetical protein